MYLQGQLVGKVTGSLAAEKAAKAAYEATRAASDAQVLEAAKCQQAAIKHAKGICERMKETYGRAYKAGATRAHSEQEEAEKIADERYVDVVLALQTEHDKTSQACISAASEALEMIQEQWQVRSGQEEVLRQLTSVLNAAEAAHQVYIC